MTSYAMHDMLTNNFGRVFQLSRQQYWNYTGWIWWTAIFKKHNVSKVFITFAFVCAFYTTVPWTCGMLNTVHFIPSHQTKCSSITLNWHSQPDPHYVVIFSKSLAITRKPTPM